MIIYCEELPYPEVEEEGPQFEFEAAEVNSDPSNGADGGSEL